MKPDHQGSAVSFERSTYPIQRVPLWRLRASVCAAVLAAFALELVARYMRHASNDSVVLSKVISLSALGLLCIVALYLICLVEGRYFLKWMVIFATTALVASQCLSIVREMANARGNPDSLVWAREPEDVLLLTGIVVLLASFYFALLETVMIKTELTRERSELYREIAERKQAQSELNASRDQLRRLTAHVEGVREDERTQIAREVHDELGQTLTSMKIDLANLKRFIIPAPGSGTQALDTISSMAKQVDVTMNAVRRIATELRPGVLDDLGLDAAIEWQVRDFQKRTNVACDVRVEPVETGLSRDKATALFRMLQEALTNVARHAGATHVTVRLAKQDGATVLEVVDNGCGFDPLQTSGGATFGLLGMRERTAQYGGVLSIESSPGRGAQIAVTLPTHDRGV